MQNLILETKDYSIFKYIEGNRTINSGHVHNLIESIKKENLLHLKPIVVDDEGYILDGQHRYQAAKTLGVSVFFYRTKSTNHSEVIKLNQNNKNWKLLDFLNFHAFRNKNDNYLQIIQTMNTYGWNLQEFFIFCHHPIRKVKIRKEFEDGLFIFSKDSVKFTDYFSKWKTIKNFISEKKLEHGDCVDSLVFKESFLFFHESTVIKIEQFWEKLRGFPNIFHRCRNKDEYLDMFLRIYNYGVTYKIEKGMLY